MNIGVIQGAALKNYFITAVQRDVNHHAAALAVLPFRCLQNKGQVLRLQRGHKAHGAEVDAENRHAPVTQLPDDAEHRPVTADDDGKGELSRHIGKAEGRKVGGKGFIAGLGENRAERRAEAGV